MKKKKLHGVMKINIQPSIFFGIILILLITICDSCKSDKTSEQVKTKTASTLPSKKYKVPPFLKDSAYKHIETQVSFGPRLINTAGHAKNIKYISNTLKRYGFDVVNQKFNAETYYKEAFEGVNIIGTINPNEKKRILLAAHWDTRHIAEQDSKQPKKPILGADDGGSGVGVLLEIARVLSLNKIENIGIDLVFFDAEDLGNPEDSEEAAETWCLGSQYWSQNPHIANYNAEFGILLDMVGAKNAQFNKEYFSLQSAPDYIFKIWNLAESIGYKKYFFNIEGGAITDDHVYVIKNLKIPMIDIINHNGTTFGSHWHTQQDNLQVIDKETLQAVGQTVTAVIFNFASGTL